MTIGRMLVLGLAVAAISGQAVAKAYVINEINVTDPAQYQTYAAQVPDTLKPYDGRFLVRGGAGEAWDGAPPSPRTVILEFPDRAHAKAWRESAAYQKIYQIRQASSTSRVYVVDGVEP